MTDRIAYVESPEVSAQELADLFRSSGIRRPVDDLPRLEKMLKHANLVIGAYLDNHLVGIARALTDFSYCCYLSDLAVLKEHQQRGIGRELIAQVQSRVGGQTMLLLLSAPDAMEYYPKVGFVSVSNGWMIKRTT
ncbi:MAG: GNAT family N-acetyltransferase [Gammaproteobacteria bacterium]